MEIGTVASTKIILFENIFLFSSSLFLFFFVRFLFSSSRIYKRGFDRVCLPRREKNVMSHVSEKCSERTKTRLLCSRARDLFTDRKNENHTEEWEQVRPKKPRKNNYHITMCSEQSGLSFELFSSGFNVALSTTSIISRHLRDLVNWNGMEFDSFWRRNSCERNAKKNRRRGFWRTRI